MDRDLQLGRLFHSETASEEFPGVIPTVFTFDTYYFLKHVKNPAGWGLQLPDLSPHLDFWYESKDQHLAANDAWVTLSNGIAMALHGQMVNRPDEDWEDRFYDIATDRARTLPKVDPHADTPPDQIPPGFCWQQPEDCLMHVQEHMEFPYSRDLYFLGVDLEHNDHKAFPWQCRRHLNCQGVCHRQEITEFGIAGLHVNKAFEIPPGMLGREWRKLIWTRTWRLTDVPTNQDAPGKIKKKPRHNLAYVFKQNVEGSKIEHVSKADFRDRVIDLMRSSKTMHAVPRLTPRAVLLPFPNRQRPSLLQPQHLLPQRPAVNTMGVDVSEEEEEEEEEEEDDDDSDRPPWDREWSTGFWNLWALDGFVTEQDYNMAMLKTCPDTLQGQACTTPAQCYPRGMLFACKDLVPNKVCSLRLDTESC